MTDSHEEDFPPAARRLRLEVLDAVRRRAPVAARWVGDLVRIGLLVELLLERRIWHEREAFHTGRRPAAAVRHHDAAAGDVLTGASGEETFDTGLCSLARQKVEDVDEWVWGAAAVGIPDSEGTIREEEVDLPKAEVAALDPRREAERRIGELLPDAALDRRP